MYHSYQFSIESNMKKIRKTKLNYNNILNVLYVLFIIAVILLISFTKKMNSNKKSAFVVDSTQISEYVEPKIEEYDLSLVMVGDCLIHGSIADDAKNKSTGTYNFNNIFFH